MVGVDLLQRDVGFVWQRLGGRQMQPAKKGMQDPAVITHDKASSYPSAQFVGSPLSRIRTKMLAVRAFSWSLKGTAALRQKRRKHQ